MNNSEKVRNSLRILENVFEGFGDYRVIGSVLVAAINGKPHRELHDVDLLIDEKIYDEISRRFVKNGFKRNTNKIWGFKWDEYERKDCVTFGVLLKGKFMNKYFQYKANKFLELRIKNEYLKQTAYELFGVQFIGIPLRSVYEGIKIANFNSKRKVDKEVVIRKTKNKLPSGLSINNAFEVRILKINIPYLYILFSYLYNIVGGVRLLFGRPYDFWK